MRPLRSYRPALALHRAARFVTLGTLVLAGCGKSSSPGGLAGISDYADSNPFAESEPGPDGDTAPPQAEGTGSDSEGSTGPEEIVCERPDGLYANCVEESASACRSSVAGCLVNSVQNPVWGVCFAPCETECDCWAPPPDGSAIPACVAARQGTEKTCVLECGDGRECPDGMRCLALNGAVDACVYDAEASE